jgi:hypothetical protein
MEIKDGKLIKPKKSSEFCEIVTYKKKVANGEKLTCW